MLYDIPARSVVPIEVDTLLRLAEHPRITAVKDAKGDLYAGARVINETDLAYYSGDDVLLLPWMSIGAVGIVSIVAHVVGPQIRALVDAANAGDLVTARHWHDALMPRTFRDGPDRRRRRTRLRQSRPASAGNRSGRSAAAPAAGHTSPDRADRQRSGPSRRTEFKPKVSSQTTKLPQRQPRRKPHPQSASQPQRTTRCA